VGLEDVTAPETLLLDATNLAPLFGGEAALVAQAEHALRRRGLETRLALADTVSAAWALAHYGGAHQISPGLCPGVALPHKFLSSHNPQAEPGAEDALPLAALRLPEQLLDTLTQLGATCIGDVLALPRDQLRSRFGPLLLLRINQLLGAAPEVIVAVDPPEEFAVEQAFEYPLSRSDAIQYTIEKLLARLEWLLAIRRRGALALSCQFACEGEPAAEFQFGLFQPTADARHLLEIAELQLERLRLPAPTVGIELRVLRHGPLAERQGTLFDNQRNLDASRPLAALIDRLAGRLGREAVVRIRPRSDAQPELSYRESPFVTQASGGRQPPALSRRTALSRPPSSSRRSTKRPASALRLKAGDSRPPLAFGALDRPLKLLATPVALEAMSVEEGPPIAFHDKGVRHVIARKWGPERIETGWWRRERAVRDYYRVETEEGRRFWLFRRRRDERWFLHGSFE
jgi:protein ImuB